MKHLLGRLPCPPPPWFARFICAFGSVLLIVALALIVVFWLDLEAVFGGGAPVGVNIAVGIMAILAFFVYLALLFAVTRLYLEKRRLLRDFPRFAELLVVFGVTLLDLPFGLISFFVALATLGYLAALVIAPFPASGALVIAAGILAAILLPTMIGCIIARLVQAGSASQIKT